MSDERASRSAGSAPIAVQLLGRFAVRRGRTELADRDIGSRKARTLLKLLAVEHPDHVSTDRIIEAVWVKEPPDRADEAVATLVSRLRGVLGSGAIAGGRGAYALARSEVEVDLSVAASLVSQAEARAAAAEPALASATASRAIALLGRARLLEEEADAPWADQARRRAGLLLRRSRRVAWTAALALDDPEAAFAAADPAIADDPLDEEAQRAVMRSFWRRGEPAEALVVYERLRSHLVDQLGADPGPETAALYVAILRGDADPEQWSADRSPAAGGVATADPSLVGRHTEMATLAAAWTRAIAHRPGIAVIVGEAGIGKTRLTEEVARLAASTGGRTLRVRCYEAERSLFLNPFAELIRSAVSSLPPRSVRAAAAGREGPLGALVPEVFDITGPVAHEPAGPEVEHRRVFDAVTTFLRRLADEQATVLVLDDLQNANASTLELLHYLGSRLTTEALLMLPTLRLDESTEALDQLAPPIDRIDLGPLPPDAVAQLAAGMGVAGSAEVVLARTSGHTLFVVEALRELRAADGGHATRDVPESLRVMTLARLHRAGPAVEHLLRAAAVIGSTFELELLSEVLGQPITAVASWAEAALRARLLSDRGAAYDFANDLIREVLYETTPGPTRTVLHRRLIALLADNPEAVAHHATAVGDWRMAVDGWCRSAARASAAFANHDADRLLHEALDACDALGDALLTAEVLAQRGTVREALGDYVTAHADFLRALGLARACGAESLEVSLLERLGWVLYYGRAVLPPALSAQAFDYAERASQAPAAAPSTRVLLACLRHADGDLAGAEEAFAQAHAADLDAPTGALLATREALWSSHVDRFAQSGRLADTGADDCRRLGLFRPMVTALFTGALAYANAGDFAAALARLARMGECLDEFDDPQYRARHQTTLSWIWRELGDAHQAAEAIDAAIGILAGAGALLSHPARHAALGEAECALVIGDEDRARRLLAAADSHPDIAFGYDWRVALRRQELACRLAPEEAEGLFDLARQGHSPKYQALALARLGRHERAAAVAELTGSDLLLAEVGPAPAAQGAIDRIGARLSPELRRLFLARGRVVVTLERRH